MVRMQVRNELRYAHELLRWSMDYAEAHGLSLGLRRLWKGFRLTILGFTPEAVEKCLQKDWDGEKDIVQMKVN